MLVKEIDLFETPEVLDNKPDVSEWGTFKDSLKAPVHGWFTYPAGFSFKAVEHSVEQASLRKGESTIYDPFMGSGTTNLVAKSLGYNSAGVEAHPFVFPITRTKMNWDISLEVVVTQLEILEKRTKNIIIPPDINGFLRDQFPELILKCFLPETLLELWAIREGIKSLEVPGEVRDFFNTGLICVLRDVSIAATGWPYIAPGKTKVTSKSKKGWGTYQERILKMVGDISKIKKKSSSLNTHHTLIFGDSRSTIGQIDDHTIDHIFTSPPYLNNFDYADRTRLEMYFMGVAKDWGEISQQVRTKLITSATTQISRNDQRYLFSKSFIEACPTEYAFLSEAVDRLSSLREVKGGKKSYDLLTVGYFNDIYEIIKDNFRVLKPGSTARYILGDSAPYGVHIPTDELIGRIGVCVGFKSFEIQVLRERGGKWKNNPQRHGVALRESVVTLIK